MSLRLFDVSGRAVETLVRSAESAGWHEVPLDGHDLATGIYFLKLEAGGQSRTVKLLHLD